MSIQQLKRDLIELREALKPETPKYLVIFYDSELRGLNQNISIEAITGIQGFDITGYTLEEIKDILDSAPVHLYLPEKEPYPGVTCDYSNS